MWTPPRGMWDPRGLPYPHHAFFVEANICFSAFREFLVDLMAEPGTLIPADILSAKDASFNSYNPRLSKTPTFWTANDLGFGYSRPEPSHGNCKAGNGKSIVEKNTTLDRKSSPQKTESMPSFMTASRGILPIDVGNSSAGNSKVVLPTNQSHQLSSLAATTSSQNKGNHGGLVVGDGAKQHINVVPYSQDTVEDTQNLFADLNPFQIIGSSKTSAQNKPAENKVNDFQRRRENIASGPGRPPLPLMWKNRSSRNEVPRTKQYEFAEGLLPRNNREPKDYNALSLASSSYTTSEKVYPEIPKVNTVEVQGISYSASTSKADGDSSGGGNSVSALSTNQYNRFPFDKGGSQTDRSLTSDQSPKKDHQEEYHYRGGEVLQNNIIDERNERGKNVIGKNDRRKQTHDRFMSTNLKMKVPENSSSSVDVSPSKLDSMPDDVAECEIPWEDLIIGERIGLGTIFQLS